MTYVWIVLAGLTAFATGRNVIGWTIATYFFGWFVLVPLVFMPKNSVKLGQRLDYLTEMLDNKISKQQFRNVDNVDDLFNQLKKK